MDTYEIITNRIINALESGVIPWHKEWKVSGNYGRLPFNYITRKRYRGINSIMLMLSGYDCNAWMTYKQAQSIGANVRKGEHGTLIVYWHFNKRAENGGDTVPIPSADGGEESKGRASAWAKCYTVFNVEQIDGLPKDLPFEAIQFNPIDSAENVVNGYMSSVSHPSINHGGDRAYYRLMTDHVQMPLRESFSSAESYYCTLFHEFSHSTGAKHRLNRADILDDNSFGSDSYSNEELCAEFSAAFLSAECGISNDQLLTNSTAYIQGWLKKLKNDKKIAIYAAQRAQRAADYILQRPGVDHVG